MRIGGAVQPTPQDEDRLRFQRRRARNWALFFALLAFVALVYVISLVKLGGG
jgi:hypothetical protein